VLHRLAWFFAAALMLAMSGQASGASAQSQGWRARAMPMFRVVANASTGDGSTPYMPSPLSIRQDRTGFIWIGSEAGLARWDGHRIRTTLTSDDAACALPTELALTLAVDNLDRLWVGSVGFLAWYDSASDCMRSSPAVRDALGGAVVTGIASDSGGGLWVATSDGLRHLDASLTRLTTPAAIDGDGIAVARQRVVRVLRDRAGALWIAGDGGLARLGSDGRRIDRIALPATVRGRSLLQASDGSIWLGTAADGAFAVDAVTLAVRAVPGIRRAEGMPLLIDVAEAPNREIWFATPVGGIVRIDPLTLTVRTLRLERGVPGSLPSNVINAIYTDRSGLVWVATSEAVGYFSINDRFAHIASNAADPALPYGPVDAAAALEDGRVALAIADRIIVAGPAPGDVEEVSLQLPSPPQSITQLATPDGYNLLVSMQPHGVVWIDRRTRRTQIIPLPGPGVSRHPVSLLVDGESVWVGALEGIWRIGSHVPRGANEPPWLAHLEIASPNNVVAARTPDGSIWLGSADGLKSVRPGTRQALRVVLRDAAGGQFADPNVAAMHVDRRGRLWVAANRAGVYVLEPTRDRAQTPVVARQLRDELSGMLTGDFLEDARGNIWLTTDRGLARIDGTDFSVQHYTRGDGVWASATARRAAVATVGGDLLFGGPYGITVVRPDAPLVASDPPAVVVTRVMVGNREVPSTRFNSLGEPEPLELPVGVRAVTVDFAALDFADPTRSMLEHRLDGLDREWMRTEMRSATYMNLAPGSYRLRLRGADRFGNWSPRERSWVVTVAASWYETVWFRVLLAATIAGVFVALVQFRTVLLRRRQRELEAVVADRTRALVEATAARTNLVANLAHDLRTPLTSIRAYLERLGVGESTLTDDERRSHLAVAMRQAERLNRRVQELFDLARLHDAGTRLAMERFVPADLVQDLAHEFAAIAEGRTVRFQLARGVEAVQIVGDISLIQRLIENLVDNALRHTPADGWMQLSLAADGGELVLQVADNGSGIDEADLERIFDRYQRGDNADRIAGTGLGLAIVKRIAELHGGSVSVSSSSGGGAVFTVRLPIRDPRADEVAT
jgi:signal transduction histidine kinase/ligand-binding sensor domain-containing protein